MKKFIAGFFCLMFVIMLAGNAAAAKKVLVVLASPEDQIRNVGTYLTFFQGLEEILKPEGIKPEYLYTDLEKQPSDDAKRAYAKGIIAEVLKKKPDVLVPLADVTVKYVASEIDSIPSIFGYVYGSIEGMNLPKPNITGVNRRSYAPDIWGLAAKLFGAKKVALLSKNSVSMSGVKKVLMSKADGLEKLCGVRLLDMYLVDSFSQWENQVNHWPADFIYLADPSRLTNADGSEMKRADAVKWTVEHSKVPVIAATGEDVEAGALYTILTSEKKWGNQTATMVLRYLKGTPIKDLPMETVKKGALVINGKTAVKYKLDIPYEVLSSAEKVIE